MDMAYMISLGTFGNGVTIGTEMIITKRLINQLELKTRRAHQIVMIQTNPIHQKKLPEEDLLCATIATVLVIELLEE
jgi:hypothetical protein